MSSDGNSVLDQAVNLGSAWNETIKNPLSAERNLDKAKKAVFGAPKINGAASSLTQTAEVERSIYGGAEAGAIDPQTRVELLNELTTGDRNLSSGGNNQTYEERAARGVGISARLDQIAAGLDPTVNDRLRINNTLLNLKDRPGRSGLVG